eukprot:scaffold5479_cov199-Amphora_coffeaeformis.AAC.31
MSYLVDLSGIGVSAIRSASNMGNCAITATELAPLDLSNRAASKRIMLAPSYCRNKSGHHPTTELPFVV